MGQFDKFFEGSGHVGFEMTAGGVPCIHAAGVMFFRDLTSGRPIAAKLDATAVRYAEITPGGLEWDEPMGLPVYN